MKLIQGLATIVLTLALAAAVGAGAWYLVTHKPAAASAAKAAPPATMPKVVKEDELNVVTLSEAAEKRIGLQVEAVVSKPVRRVRVYGGEVTVPVGRTILAAAPIGGSLKAPHGGLPMIGRPVKAGQPVLDLLPLLTPDGQATLSASLADSDGLVNSAKAQVEAGKIALERARRVLREGAGSQRLVDEAQAAFDIASKSFDAANARRSILGKVLGSIDGGTAAPLTITAPQDGILRALSAMPGQVVPGGAPLFEVVDLSTLWIRVPLPVGDLDAIDRKAPAQIGKLSSPPGSPGRNAELVTAPPTANPLSATVDLFYQLANADGALTPGQRMGVTIPLGDVKESVTVPWSALVFDINGGTWLYEEVGPHRYVRKRAVVAYTLGSAVLSSGPAPGTKIVTAGVQQLFGAETGFVK